MGLFIQVTVFSIFPNLFINKAGNRTQFLQVIQEFIEAFLIEPIKDCYLILEFSPWGPFTFFILKCKFKEISDAGMASFREWIIMNKIFNFPFNAVNWIFNKGVNSKIHLIEETTAWPDITFWSINLVIQYFWRGINGCSFFKRSYKHSFICISLLGCTTEITKFQD